MPSDTEDTDHLSQAEVQEPTTDQQQPSKTPSDPAEVRQEATPKEEPSRDDANDPLILAQMPEEKPAPKVEPTPTKTTTTEPTPAPKADEPKAETKDEIPEEADALADLPSEDWQKLGHRAKSQFLAQRKTLKAYQTRMQEQEQARKDAEERSQAIEQFVEDNGLSHEEYANVVHLSGRIKRADPSVIPALEATLENLRQAAGIKAPAAEPVLDDTLKEVLDEAESFGIDVSKVRDRFTAPKKPETAPKQEPAPQAHAHQVDEVTEFRAISDSLMALGVPESNIQAHVAGLMQKDPSLMAARPGERLKAVLKAHQQASQTQVPPRSPSSPPLSTRGRPVATGGKAQPTNDPLALARMRTQS